ncbi:Vegetative incompatibility protein HET-E-1 [Rhizoctonia solani AG-1 IB]|uniref:Vegetative incompatibility protein HET-E-1 n=1 Tax=Thanatephorus cucumeris (strain AG1-IB / isolate 7/3/14) TaxID=1108050 RepID=M5CBL5_THACB|nr:Vegetative incompatibility protein HET-E-1 [Rhizoctonia solani AG-1 IB]
MAGNTFTTRFKNFVRKRPIDPAKREASPSGATGSRGSSTPTPSVLETPSSNTPSNADQAENRPGPSTSATIPPLIILPPETNVTIREPSTPFIINVVQPEQPEQSASIRTNYYEALGSEAVSPDLQLKLYKLLEALRQKWNNHAEFLLFVEAAEKCISKIQHRGLTRMQYEDLVRTVAALGESRLSLLNGTVFEPAPCTVSSLIASIDLWCQRIRASYEHETGTGASSIGSIDNYKYFELILRRLRVNTRMEQWYNKNAKSINDRLRLVPPVKNARYKLGPESPTDRRSCTKDTRTEILSGLSKWLDDRKSPSVYWVDGMPGTGKTTIAYTFCEQMEERKRLAASFFCTDKFPGCQDVTQIIPTIAQQLAQYSVSFRLALYEALGHTPDAASRHLNKQFDLLLDQPLQKAKDSIQEKLVVVIDAMDECDSIPGIEAMLKLLISKSSGLPLKFLITSRPKVEIFVKMSSGVERKEVEAIHLQAISDSQKADIRRFLCERLAFISPTEPQIDQLLEHCGVSFRTAYHLSHLITEGMGNDPKEQLRLVLEDTPTPANLHAPVNDVYLKILQDALEDEDLEDHEIEDIRVVLHTALIAKEPVDIATINMLAGIGDSERVSFALLSLRSLLWFSEVTGLVAPLDPAVPQIMFDEQRSGSYFCNIGEESRLLAQGCLLEMKEKLRFNKCELGSSFILDEQIEDLQNIVKGSISPSLTYACRHWADHLEAMANLDIMLPVIGDFLSERLFFWIEVLNLRKELGIGLTALLKIKRRLDKIACPPGLITLLDDSYDFLKEFAANSVSKSTPHLYLSALQLCHRSSFVYRIYSKRVEHWIDPLICPEIRWNWKASQNHIWKIDSGALSIAYSPDGTRVAFGCENGTIAICDPRDGSLLLDPIAGHTNWVRCVVFSPDGTSILSASSDCTIRLWDAVHGQPIGTPFLGHTHPVKSVAFSPDGKQFVSGSWDNTVCLWNIEDHNAAIKISESHKWGVNCVAFSPKGRLVASGANDHTVKLWNLASDALLTQKIHTGSVMSIVFTPDGRRLISASADCTICVWDVEDNLLENRMLQCCSHSIYSVTVSPDGRYFASGSADSTIMVWDVGSGGLIAGPLENLSGARALAFSPDSEHLLSGSHDKAIKVWDLLRRRDQSISRVFWRPEVQEGPVSGLEKFKKLLGKSLEDNMARIRELHEEKLPSQCHTPKPATSVMWLLEGTRLAYSSQELDTAHRRQLTDKLAKIQKEWKCQPDGWIVDNKSRYFIWVPNSVSCELQEHVVSNNVLLASLLQHSDFIGNRWPREFANLKPHNTIYKMVGPVLVKQDQEEAKSNVDKRLEFIRGEISRVEQQISDLNKKSEKIKTEVVTIQNVIASQQQSQAAAA